MKVAAGVLPTVTGTSIGADDLLRRPAGKADLTASAKEFESILLGQWLQAAESSFASVPGADSDDDGDEQMKSFGVQQLAIALTQAGGIGIAAMVTKALQHSGGVPTSGATQMKGDPSR